ncbi:TPA: helix-turn-helix transcriptional regulator [Aeromonas dhakensis]|nr:helix-turn-helix transcriptional regulator [Aeromonas dhakensis]
MNFYIKNTVFDKFICYVHSVEPDYDCAKLLQHSGLSAEDITNCDIFLDYLKVGNLFAYSAKQLKKPLFSLLYAQYINNTHQTIIDRALPLLKSLDMIYHFVNDYLGSHTNAISCDRYIDDGRVFFNWTLLPSEIDEAISFQMNIFFAYRTYQQIYKIVKGNFSDGGDIIIHIPYEYESTSKLFHCALNTDLSCNFENILFDNNGFAISFPSHYNEILFDFDKTEIFRFIENIPSINAINVSLCFSNKVYWVIKNNMYAGKRCDLVFVSNLLCMHPRTLQIRLSKENNKFIDILNNVRKDIVVNMLADKSVPIYIISDKLGFSDSAIFSRAFKTWFNITPSEWRKLNLI